MKDHPGLDPKTTRHLTRLTRRSARPHAGTPVLIYEADQAMSEHDFLVPNLRPDLESDFFVPAPPQAFIEVRVL